MEFFPACAKHVGMVQDLVFFDGDQQDIHLRVHGLQQLVIQVHVRDIEGNVLAGFGLDAVVQLFLGHGRKRNALDDHRVPGNRGGHILCFYFVGIEYVADSAGDEAARP